MENVPFYRKDLDRSSSENSPGSLYEAIKLVEDPLLKQQIYLGNVTLAMIRPSIGPEDNILGLPDLEAEARIEEMIHDLGFLAKFSIRLDQQAIEEFYSGSPEERMLKQEAEKPETYDSRWPEFVDFMISGPTTIILLHEQNGDAVQTWRNHLGHWNVEKKRDLSTIRGKLAVDQYNNLVHGGDSPESVIRELGIVSRVLSRSIKE